MKELIAIDTQEVNTQVDKVIEVVKIINENSEVLNKNGYSLTIEDVQMMIYDTKAFEQKAYLKSLEPICEMFGEDFDKVKTKEYRINVTDMFHKMAVKKCGWLLSIVDELRHFSYFGDNIFLNYIEIKDNIASPKLNFEQDIKEYYSHYTKNSKQVDITKALKKMQKNIDEIIKLGYSGYDIKNFINWNSNEINYHRVEAL